MKLDKTITPVSLCLLAMVLTAPLITLLPLSMVNEQLLFWVEKGQTAWLLFCMLFTLCYMSPRHLPKGPKLFWLWSALWWLILFGRDTNWGRLFFPEEPRIIFKAVAGVLIITLVATLLLSSELRRQIKTKYRNTHLPIWSVIWVISAFLLADAVEHHELFSSFYHGQEAYRDLLEELYEIPFMLGLFMIALKLMRMDKQRLHALSLPA